MSIPRLALPSHKVCTYIRLWPILLDHHPGTRDPNTQKSAFGKERSQRRSLVSCSSEQGVLDACNFGSPTGLQDTLNPVHRNTPTWVAAGHQSCSLQLLVAAIFHMQQPDRVLQAASVSCIHVQQEGHLEKPASLLTQKFVHHS